MSNPIPGLARRRFIGTAAGAVGAVALWAVGTGTATAAPKPGNEPAAWKGKNTANGWPVVTSAPAQLIEGSSVSVAALDGDVATILLHVARRFHYEVDSLRQGEVTGHSGDRRVAQPYESNYLSGTAIAIRPQAYPTGVRGGLYPHELVIVRDILTELDGTVAWGGDEKTAKESHFHIALKPGHPKIKNVARKIREWNEAPGKGAGTVDAFEPSRRRAAKAFTR